MCASIACFVVWSAVDVFPGFIFRDDGIQGVILVMYVPPHITGGDVSAIVPAFVREFLNLLLCGNLLESEIAMP